MKDFVRLLNVYGSGIGPRLKQGAVFDLLRVWNHFERVKSGSANAGDAFGLLRNLFVLVRGLSEPADAVRLIVQLARDDETTLMPWHIRFVPRRTTRAMRSVEQQMKQDYDASLREDRDQELFIRVLRHLQASGCSIDEAYHAVANAKDELRRKTKKARQTYSVAVVKRAYEAQLKIAKRSGRVSRNVGVFGARAVHEPLPTLRARGRPKKIRS